MRRSTRRSSVGLAAPEDSLDTSVQNGNFSTRFSLPSFVKRVEKLTDDQRNAIRNIGFGNLLLMPSQMLSKNLLVELMERWSCEKRAFMLLPDAITITLMDVALILGLRVIGHPVLLRENEPFSDLEKEYGATSWTRKITVASLESRLDSIGGVVNDDFTRTFLLFTIGTLLFPNANGKVDTRYLSLFKNLDNICHFAWGAAVLEDLFTWLNKRKETNVQYVGGCLIFLQIWSYEHINIARPSLLDSYLTFPRACRWENSRSHHRQWITAKFKELQDNQMTWELQPTSAELEIDIIKELLGAPNANGVPGSQCTSDTFSIVSVIEVESKSGTPGTRFPNSAELEFDIIKESFEHPKNEVPRQQCTSDGCSFVSVVEVESESDMDTANEVEVGRGQELNSEQLMASKFIPEVQTDTMENSSISSMSELNKQMGLASQCQQSSMDFTNGNEDYLRRKNQLLQAQYMELKKEMENLKSENRTLRSQLLSSQLLEEQYMDLKKEMEKLKSENRTLRNQLLSIPVLEEQNLELMKLADDLRRKDQSADNLVVQLETLLLDVGITATEET